MNYRTATILAAKDLGGSGTEPIAIKITDIISRITLKWGPLKGQNGDSAPQWKDITKIELVDGSDVLHSMNGGENQALCIYDRKCPTMNEGCHINANISLSTYAIDFGRYLFDPVLALDPKRFNNLVLNVTYNEAVSDTLATAGILEVKAECFDQKMVSPMGFFMAKEHWNAAKPTAGYEYIQLPTDYPIRKMLLQAYLAAYEPWYQVSEARLDEDNEKRIPFDWDLEQYLNYMIGIWTPVREKFMATITQDSPYFVTPTDYWTNLSAIGSNANLYAYITGANHKGGKIILTSSTGAGLEVNGVVSGYLPNHCFEFPFGNPQDMDDWYDVTKVGSLRLRLKAGTGASTTTGVVLQQLRRY